MAKSYYEADMSTVVNCAQCGKELVYADSYTSLEVQTPLGFGYAVCADCYEKEWQRRRARMQKEGASDDR